ncbi:helix-turn-helix domain-containing protein [Nostoc sp. CHAB 5844]|nr:helix-turn-helix domain-containing protein [Nostoc sp. CHAB 5844]
MDKKQAAGFLGVTTRTIENYAKAGKLSVIYIAKKATYKPEELEVLKQELETPIHRSIVATANETEIELDARGLANAALTEDVAKSTKLSEIELSESFGATIPQIAELLGAIVAGQNLWRKLIWNLDEAAAASGYSRFHLRGAIALGHLRAQKIGRGWKIRPQDLEEYTNWLFGESQNHPRIG